MRFGLQSVNQRVCQSKNMTQPDQSVASSSSPVPVGTILPFWTGPGNELDSDFRFCDGSDVSITQFPELFELLSYAYTNKTDGNIQVGEGAVFTRHSLAPFGIIFTFDVVIDEGTYSPSVLANFLTDEDFLNVSWQIVDGKGRFQFSEPEVSPLIKVSMTEPLRVALGFAELEYPKSDVYSTLSPTWDVFSLPNMNDFQLDLDFRWIIRVKQSLLNG